VSLNDLDPIKCNAGVARLPAHPKQLHPACDFLASAPQPANSQAVCAHSILEVHDSAILPCDPPPCRSALQEFVCPTCQRTYTTLHAAVLIKADGQFHCEEDASVLELGGGGVGGDGESRRERTKRVKAKQVPPPRPSLSIDTCARAIHMTTSCSPATPQTSRYTPPPHHPHMHTPPPQFISPPPPIRRFPSTALRMATSCSLATGTGKRQVKWLMASRYVVPAFVNSLSHYLPYPPSQSHH